MSEGFELEPFHVPQQSRRDKLRERETAATSIQGGCAGLLPLYDPSLLSSAMLTCASTDMHHHHHNQTPPFIKEEGMNFMGFVGAGAGAGFLPSSASSASASSQLLLDLTQSSVVVSANPNYNQEDINIGNASNPFFYSSQIPQNVRDFDPSFVENGGVAFKPHPLSYAPQDASSTGQGLSLSLSSHYRNRPDSASGAGIFDGKGVGNYVVRGVPAGDSMPRCSVPIGPFTGYTAILKGSRFLRPAQQLLEEICDVGRGFYVDRSGGESSSSREMESLSESGLVDEGHIGESDQGERRRMKARLISMLHEVYKRYKQYCQQLQDVVISFESVAGLSTAAPYTSLAIKAMSKHFRCLKNAITDQLRFTTRVLTEESSGKDENQSFGLVDHGVRQQKAAHNLSIHDQPHIWRPQRGLPERAVAVLRAWLFEHFLHPYPTDADKQLLAKQTGLSRNQVSNWFINARVRLWKPMVEEIHTLEMRQSQRVSEGSNDNSKEQCELPAVPVLPMDKQPENSTTEKNQDPPPKRYRNELANLPNNCAESMNFSYDNVASHHQGGISLARGNGGISLTLGLHQNNSSGLSEPLPVTVGHFGLMDNSNPYVMGDFESQNRHLGRDIGGQLLRDFVG